MKILSNKPLDDNKRMPSDPEFFTDFPAQPSITVDSFNKQINSETELGEDPMFVNAAAGDFSLKEGSPAIGSGDNGVNRGAYAVYPKTKVGFNKSLGLTEDTNLSFAKPNSAVKSGNVVDVELKLNKAAHETMTFEVVPVAGDARIGKDFRFADDQKITFNPGEKSKTVRVEILEGYDLDQLLVLKIQPVGNTKAEYESGEIVTINAKTREGYTFAGWETGCHDIKLPLADENSAVTTFVMPEWNPTIRAKWKLNGELVNVT